MEMDTTDRGFSAWCGLAWSVPAGATRRETDHWVEVKACLIVRAQLSFRRRYAAAAARSLHWSQQ